MSSSGPLDIIATLQLNIAALQALASEGNTTPTDLKVTTLKGLIRQGKSLETQIQASPCDTLICQRVNAFCQEARVFQPDYIPSNSKRARICPFGVCPLGVELPLPQGAEKAIGFSFSAIDIESVAKASLAQLSFAKTLDVKDTAQILQRLDAGLFEELVFFDLVGPEDEYKSFSANDLLNTLRPRHALWVEGPEEILLVIGVQEGMARLVHLTAMTGKIFDHSAPAQLMKDLWPRNANDIRLLTI